MGRPITGDRHLICTIFWILMDQFQFIIITDNRRTMEILDTLYGVTMQEPGVSSIVGVDMKKDLPPHLRKAFKEEGSKEAVKPAASAAPTTRISGATAVDEGESKPALSTEPVELAPDFDTDIPVPVEALHQAKLEGELE